LLMLHQRGDGLQALRHRSPKTSAKQGQDQRGRSFGAGVDGQPQSCRRPPLLWYELGALVKPEGAEAHFPGRMARRLVPENRCDSMYATAALSTHDAGCRARTYRLRRRLAHLQQIGIPPRVVLEVARRDEVEHDLRRSLQSPLDGHDGHATPRNGTLLGTANRVNCRCTAWPPSDGTAAACAAASHAKSTLLRPAWHGEIPRRVRRDRPKRKAVAVGFPG
jgi:hypothetical protein